jgi:hypothetical protein
MRRTLSVILVLVAATMLIPQIAHAQQGIRVYVDGRLVNFDVPPQVIQGRVLVPVRGVFEQLGATVDYDARTQHIVALRGSQNVELTIGSRQAQVNGTPHLLDVPAFTINGRTMVPLRFISESLGAEVQWVDASRTILIASPGTALVYPQASQQPQPTGNISGRLVGVTTGDNPQLVVRSNAHDYTIPVTSSTAIFRSNAATNVGGSAPLGALHVGDRVTVAVDSQGHATRIDATYSISAPPVAVTAPTIGTPANGATVGSTFTVSGRANPGAQVVVRVQPRILGQSAQGQATAGPDGSWSVNMSVSSLPVVSFPYVVSAYQVANGVTSDSTSIEVTVH